VDVIMQLTVADLTAPDLGLPTDLGLHVFRTDDFQLSMIGHDTLAVQEFTLCHVTAGIVAKLEAFGLAHDPDDLAPQIVALAPFVALGIVPEDQRTGGPCPGRTYLAPYAGRHRQEPTP